MGDAGQHFAQINSGRMIIKPTDISSTTRERRIRHLTRGAKRNYSLRQTHSLEQVDVARIGVKGFKISFDL